MRRKPVGHPNSCLWNVSVPSHQNIKLQELTSVLYPATHIPIHKNTNYCKFTFSESALLYSVWNVPSLSRNRAWGKTAINFRNAVKKDRQLFILVKWSSPQFAGLCKTTPWKTSSWSKQISNGQSCPQALMRVFTTVQMWGVAGAWGNFYFQQWANIFMHIGPQRMETFACWNLVKALSW